MGVVIDSAHSQPVSRQRMVWKLRPGWQRNQPRFGLAAHPGAGGQADWSYNGACLAPSLVP
eukprot:16357605-Heterocapsa_arctica.AAC.1